MGSMNEPPQSNGSVTEDEILDLYESLRAAELDPAKGVPFAEKSEVVNVDWDALEERALAVSLPERIRSMFISLPPRAVALSIIGPVFGMLATFFWLRAIPVGLTPAFVMKVIGASAIMVLMFMWAAVAMQAMDRLESLRPAPVAAPAPVPVPVSQGRTSSPSLTPVLTKPWRRETPYPSWAYAAMTVFVALGGLGVALRTAAASRGVTPAAADAIVALAAGDASAEQVEKFSQETSSAALQINAPSDSKDRKTFFTVADTAYKNVMLEESAEQREKLADQALELLNKAKKAEPNRAEILTRLAEIYFVKGDTTQASNIIAEVKRLENVSPAERSRADSIAGVLQAYNVAQHLDSTPVAQRAELAKELGETIDKVEGASKAGTDSDSGALLTHLRLAQASATEDVDKRKAIEDAISANRQTLLSRDALIRVVQRPDSLAKQLAMTEFNTDRNSVIPTTTYRSQ